MLATYLSDIFGKLGMTILSCISWVRGLMTLSLSQTNLLTLRTSLQLIITYNEEIEQVEREISWRIHQSHQRELGNLRSVSGIGDISASVIIAEMGDFSAFVSGDKLVAWAGIC